VLIRAKVLRVSTSFAPFESLTCLCARHKVYRPVERPHPLLHLTQELLQLLHLLQRLMAAGAHTAPAVEHPRIQAGC
jgi:hypothetical protein